MVKLALLLLVCFFAYRLLRRLRARDHGSQAPVGVDPDMAVEAEFVAEDPDSGQPKG